MVWREVRNPIERWIVSTPFPRTLSLSLFSMHKHIIHQYPSSLVLGPWRLNRETAKLERSNQMHISRDFQAKTGFRPPRTAAGARKGSSSMHVFLILQTHVLILKKTFGIFLLIFLSLLLFIKQFWCLQQCKYWIYQQFYHNYDTISSVCVE